jgi:hypothetical protein
MLGCCVLRDNHPDYPVYPLKKSILHSPRPLIVRERMFFTGSKEPAEQDPVRQHGVQEAEAVKAS